MSISRTSIYDSIRTYTAYTGADVYPIVSLVKLAVGIKSRCAIRFHAETRRYISGDPGDYHVLHWTKMECDWYKDGMSDDEVSAKLTEYLTLEYEQFGKDKHG